MPNRPDKKRYDIVAISLHWGMALCILLMLGSGLAFDRIDMEQSFKFNLYQWHKSLGLILLVLVAIRIGWRLFNKPPTEPSQLTKTDHILSKIGHWALYSAMVIMPFSGWVMVSSSPYGLPTFIFNLFEWPHIPGLSSNKDMNALSKDIHWFGGWAFISLITIHSLAVVKHYYYDQVNLLPRMGIGTSQTKTKD